MADLQSMFQAVDKLAFADIEKLYEYVQQRRKILVDQITDQIEPENPDDIQFIDDLINEVRREHQAESSV